MSATICLVALPVAALTIWALLRSRVAARLVAAPRRDRWHEHATPTLGGAGIFAGFAVGGARSPSPCRRWAPTPNSSASSAARRSCSSPDSSTMSARCRPGPSWRADRRGSRRARRRPPRRDRLQRRACRDPRRALARRHDERLQPARQHRRPRRDSLAVIAATFFAIDAVYLHKEACCSCSRSRSASRRSGFLPFNFRPNQPAAVFMGDSGSQVLGFVLAARAWRRAGRWPSRRWRRCSCRCSCSPSHPRHRARHRRALRRGPADHAGRPRPHVASPRPRRPGREEHGRAARHRRGGPRRLQPRLLRVRRQPR